MPSINPEMREFMSRFRFQDNALMSFSRVERKQINDFQKFAAQKPDGTCSVCLRVLYPEEQRYRKIVDSNALNCFQWKITPFTKEERDITMYMVCPEHVRTEENNFPIYIYPG